MKDMFSQTLPFNFLGLPPESCEYSTSKVVLVPLCYDLQASSTLEAPWAIIKASRFMDDFHAQLNKNFTELGLCTLPFLSSTTDHPKDIIESIERNVEKWIRDRKFIVLLGGENSIAIGAVKAFHKEYPKMGVLQFGARACVKDNYKGMHYHNTTTNRRLKEICPVVQAGIRSLSQEEHIFLKQQNQQVFYAWNRKKSTNWKEELNETLPKEIYISINLDVFDPSIMPSVRIPEPGGFLWEEMQDILKLLAQSHTILGFDVTGLCPIPGFVSPDYFAAKLIYYLIGVTHS